MSMADDFGIGRWMTRADGSGRTWIPGESVQSFLDAGFIIEGSQEIGAPPTIGPAPGVATSSGKTQPIWTSPDGKLRITVQTWESALDDLRANHGYTGYGGSVADIRGRMAAARSLADWWRAGQAGQEELGIEDLFSDLFGGLGGGGGGGGRIGPTYVAPDRDSVEEALKLYQVAVVGTVEQDVLDRAVDKFMADHRADFNNPAQQIDAVQSSREVIRQSSSYKDIHGLRPESADELQWVTSRQGKLRQLGVAPDLAEELGISLARIGATEEGVASAGEKAFQRRTGRVHQDQRTRLKDKARAVMGLI